MGDVAISVLLKNVTELILSKRQLLNVSMKEIKQIFIDLDSMEDFWESMDALDQLPGNANHDLVDETRKVIRETEDLVEIHAKRQEQLLRSSLNLSPISSIKLRNLRKKLRRIKRRTNRVRKRWEKVRFAAYRQQLLGSSFRRSGFAAMIKLEHALRVQDLHPEVLKCIKWVRHELGPLHDFLQEIDSVQVLGERQEIWIQELRGIFQFIDESLAHDDDVQGSRERGLGGFSTFDQINFSEVITEVQDKILQLYRRYYAYGFGEILVNNGSRSISPIIRLITPIPGVETSDIVWVPRKSTELLVDLKLMKALLEDSRSRGALDRRATVWLNQLQEISVDLEALDEHDTNISGGIKNAFVQLSSRSKIGRNGMQIAREIRDITARKMTYGIDSALGEPGMLPGLPSIAANFVERSLLVHPSKDLLRKRVGLLGKELQLMEALSEDVKRMEKLDAGLKVWAEEMQGVAREAKAAVLEIDYRSSYSRDQAAARINQVYNHIFMIFTWKLTYGIGDVKPGGTHIFDHNLEATGPYPSKAVEEEVELFKREIKFMQALCDNIEERDADGTDQVLVKEMRNLAIEAKNLTEQNGDMIEKRSGIDLIKDKIRQLAESKIAYGSESRRILSHSIVCEVKEKLLTDQEQSCIFPIFGMRYTHKEALQELINNDNAITNHFDLHTWVYVPEPEELSGVSVSEYTVRQIMEQQKARFLDVELASKLDPPTKEALMQMLQEMLMHKRYLIVLDEIQSVEVWQCLERVFPKISTGSRIILITNEHTCSLLNSSSKGIIDPVKLRELPLESREVMPGSGASNINRLPSYLRQCLYYFLLFPANFEIPPRRIIVLWVAEGLVRQNERESDEDVANRYLNELIELNMVLGKSKKLHGKYKVCQLNEGIRDTLSMRAKESRFFQNTPGMISRLVDHHGTIDSCFIQIQGNPKASTSVKNYQNVQLFMSFNTQEGNKPGEDLGNFLRKCISAGCFLELRVLDLEKVFRPKLPEAICDLMLLKYLGLRWTYLEHLPRYVNKLLNLQVLDVKHTYISVLPSSIWRMQYLRHLFLSETYRTKFVGRPSDVSLDELQTLWGAFIDENTYVRNGLDTAFKIRKLGLSCRSTSSHNSLMTEQLEAVNDWISNLELLEVLRLKSRDENGKASELHLKPLWNGRLSTVYLLGKLEPSVVSRFPRNLIDITLSGSELSVDPMISLEELPKLRILRLLSQSVVCRSMRCSKGGFPRLKVLKIWKLENLEEWEVEEGALHSLKDLEIRSCTNLKMLPNALQHVDKCMLTSMPEEFIDETKVRQPELWAKIKLDPSVDQEQI